MADLNWLKKDLAENARLHINTISRAFRREASLDTYADICSALARAGIPIVIDEVVTTVMPGNAPE
jgi:hypothetical protein